MAKVFCIGEMLVDLVAESSFDKAKSFSKNPGGAPANVAVQIAKLGGQVAFLGNLGVCSFGKYLQNILTGFHVDTKYISTHGKTTFALVGLNAHGERDFEFYRGSDADYNLPATILDDIKEHDIIHFGSATALLGGKLYDSYFQLLEFALEKNIFISFDPNFREDLMTDISIDDYIKDCQKFISCAKFIKLSEVELQIISGEDDIDKGITILSKMTNAIIVITLGAGGSLLVQNNQTIHLPTRQVTQIDSTGAGDAFVGAILFQLASNMNKSWEDMVLFANFVGGYTVQRHGAILAMPTLAQIQEFIND